MYIVIRKINDNQIPLRAYKNIDNAYEYQERYIQDSSKEWRMYECRSSKEKLRKRYYRYLKDNRREEIIIRYMKLY